MTPADQGISAREAEDREARERGDFVGFLACSHGGGRVLKVALPDERRAVRARCPVDGCTERTHVTGDAMPRARRRGEVCDAELVDKPAADPAPAADDPTVLHGRQTVSDAAILAAIPADRGISLSEAAAQAGYGPGGAANNLQRRLHRMNKRAEDRGETPLFELTRPPSTSGAGGRGRPTFVRRVESDDAGRTIT